MYRKWYPPSRYVCYPLYRLLRRRLGLRSTVAYLAVWIVSGALHGGLLLFFGHPLVAGAFILGFTGLGLVGAGVICMKDRRRPRRIAQPPGCSGHKSAGKGALPDGGPATRLGHSGAMAGRRR